jgi:hypothetical protein
MTSQGTLTRRVDKWQRRPVDAATSMLFCYFTDAISGARPSASSVMLTDRRGSSNACACRSDMAPAGRTADIHGQVWHTNSTQIDKKTTAAIVYNVGTRCYGPAFGFQDRGVSTIPLPLVCISAFRGFDENECAAKRATRG